MSEKKEQWIMVMNRLKGEGEFGLDTAYSVTHLGAKEAMRRAQEKMEHGVKMFSNLEFRLQGGEW